MENINIVISKIKSNIKLVSILNEETSSELSTLNKGLIMLVDKLKEGKSFEDVSDELRENRKKFNEVGIKMQDIDGYMYRSVLMYEVVKDLELSTEGLSEEDISFLEKTKSEIESSKPFNYQLKDGEVDYVDKDNFDFLLKNINNILDNDDYLMQEYLRLKARFNHTDI